jgi:hypothetical protein
MLNTNPLQAATADKFPHAGISSILGFPLILDSLSTLFVEPLKPQMGRVTRLDTTRTSEQGNAPRVSRARKASLLLVNSSALP